jgi:hypothetical protein
MHWISLISFLMIIYLCQSQPTIFKNFETGNMNKGGTFQMGSIGNNPGWFESKNNVESLVHTSTDIVPLGHVMKDEHNTLKFAANSGNNNQCYMILSLIIATSMTMIHF